jgi:UDP-glucuronate 4-epimerase
VYGLWGRPDMAYFKFVRAIELGQPIDVYNYGTMKRDFTYIDDIIEGIIRVTQRIPNESIDQNGNHAPYRLYNIGNNKPVELMKFIHIIEKAVGRSAVKNLLPMQPGDVLETFADIDDLIRDTGFKPGTSLEEGIDKFVHWYRASYGMSLAA